METQQQLINQLKADLSEQLTSGRQALEQALAQVSQQAQKHQELQVWRGEHLLLPLVVSSYSEVSETNLQRQASDAEQDCGAGGEVT